MNLIEFNNICLSLGWVKDLGYSVIDDSQYSHVFYNDKDRKDNYLVIVNVNINYVANPTEPIEEFTIHINNIEDGKIVRVDERKYDLLYKDWDVLYIRELIKGISDFLIYLYACPNIKNKDLDELLKKIRFCKIL